MYSDTEEIEEAIRDAVEERLRPPAGEHYLIDLRIAADEILAYSLYGHPPVTPYNRYESFLELMNKALITADEWKDECLSEVRYPDETLDSVSHFIEMNYGINHEVYAIAS